jgi:hypothetical protein
MFVRGRDFGNRFEQRAEVQASGVSSEDNTNGARLLELAGLLAPVTCARWVVLHKAGNESFIVNDLGLMLTRDLGIGQDRFAIPTGRRTVLATSSIGSAESVPAKNGTPVRTEASAQCRSPCPSPVHGPSTPIGAMKIGEGRLTPHSSIEVPVFRGNEHPRIQPIAVERLPVGWVCSSPAPPATYPHTFGVIAAEALAFRSANAIGYCG